MYFRETLTRRIANKTYRSVRLVESRRVGSKVQQKILLNLGASFPIPKPQWAELVEIIEAKLAKNEFLFEPAPKLAAAAESIVQRLRSRELEKPTDESLDGDTAHIKLNSVEMDNGRSAGSERLALGGLDALGLPGVLKDVGFSDRDARIAVALVVARMIHPSSEREALRWLETNSATLELLRLDIGQALKLDKLHRLSDLLVKQRFPIDFLFIIIILLYLFFKYLLRAIFSRKICLPSGKTISSRKNDAEFVPQTSVDAGNAWRGAQMLRQRS